LTLLYFTFNTVQICSSLVLANQSICQHYKLYRSATT